MSIQDEFLFIKNITPQTSYNTHLVTGIGDDAALFSGNSDVEEIVCMDTMIEEVHFIRKTMKPFHIGYKALASNISDIAAMGGYPTFYLVSIAIPKHWSEAELLDIYKGMQTLAKQFKMDLIGGDTVSSPHNLVITITVLGRIEKGKHFLRKNAKADDVVFVTGTLGDSAAGLALLLKCGCDFNFSTEEKYLIQRHQMPEPQVGAAKIFSKYPRMALNDISDGIASEANEIAEASQVTLVLDYDQLPKSSEIEIFGQEKQLNWILSGGEDYELIGTVSNDIWPQIEKQCQTENIKITKVGSVKAGPAQVLLNKDGQFIQLQKKGYNHFSK